MSVCPPIVCFVARSGTGKTTFLEKLIPQLKARGLRIGVLKHHAHATAFDVPGKDSYRLAHAGADTVVGSCALQVAVFHQTAGPTDPDELVQRYLTDVDLVLAEGFSYSRHPKIEVCRAAAAADHAAARHGQSSPNDLLAVVSDHPVAAAVPVFDLEDAAGVAEFLVRWWQSMRTADTR
jgi:molybdopterin-guanine dinucleotide biosynthesis protein B